MANWQVTTAGSVFLFDTNRGDSPYCHSVDTNHFITFYSGLDYDAYALVLEVNTSTWAVTTAGSSLEFDTDRGVYNCCYPLDTTHFINFFSGKDSDGYVQTFTVNTSTWAVTTAGSSLEFDTQNVRGISIFPIDTNHFITFWSSNLDGLNYYTNVQTFTVNTSTWAVTTAGSRLQVTTQYSTGNSCFGIDSTHYINFFGGINEGDYAYAQVFTVNTSTWAVTTANSKLQIDANNGDRHSCYKIDTNHFINFWCGTNNDGYVQVFAVNTSTWAVTTAGSILEFEAVDNRSNSCFQLDSNHFVNSWTDTSYDGRVQVFTVNTSTWAVTTAYSVLEFATQEGRNPFSYKIDTSHFITLWSGVSYAGTAQVFEVEVPVPTYETDDARSAKITGRKYSYHTKGDESVLPTDEAGLDTQYTDQEEIDVATNDGTRVDIGGSDYLIHHHARLGNGTSGISVTWDGQSTVAPSSNTVYLQIYNFNTDSWEALDSDNSTGADTDFSLTGSKTTNLSYYYDSDNYCYVRVYQGVA